MYASNKLFESHSIITYLLYVVCVCVCVCVCVGVWVRTLALFAVNQDKSILSQSQGLLISIACTQQTQL